MLMSFVIVIENLNYDDLRIYVLDQDIDMKKDQQKEHRKKILQ